MSEQNPDPITAQDVFAETSPSTGQTDQVVGLDSPEVEAVRASIKQSNDDRKADRLTRKAQKAHDWRVQVWAQSELRIRGANAELQVMGRDQYDPYVPEFGDDDLLRHYAEMPLSK